MRPPLHALCAQGCGAHLGVLHTLPQNKSIKMWKVPLHGSQAETKQLCFKCMTFGDGVQSPEQFQNSNLIRDKKRCERY